MVDVIFVNYKSTRYLLRCLDSIKSAGGIEKINIFIQDNASKDEIDQIRLPSGIQLSINSNNFGFAKAINQALQKGDADYVVLLNPDILVVNGFFESALQFMDSNPQVGLLGPRIFDENGSIQNSARSFPTPLTTFFGRSSFLSRIFPNNPVTRRNLLNLQSDGTTPMEVDWVSGACMVVRRKAIEKVGHMDERFFMYWEDADWCRRMRDHGWRVVYYPRASVYHFAGKSADQNRLRSAIEFHKSAYRLFSKYASSSIGKPFAIIGLAAHLSVVLIGKLLMRRKTGYGKPE